VGENTLQLQLLVAGSNTEHRLSPAAAIHQLRSQPWAGKAVEGGARVGGDITPKTSAHVSLSAAVLAARC
jgi:hypothetical protein